MRRIFSALAAVILLSCVEDGAYGPLGEAFAAAGCETAAGMDGLGKAFAALYGSDKIDLINDAVIWDVRQQASLSRSAEWLAEASEALAMGAEVDAVCTTVEAAAAGWAQ